MARADAYRELGESAWRWVRAQVHDDDGPWLPSSVDGHDALPTAVGDRSTIYFGIGGLALVLAELRLGRALADDERALEAAIRESVASTSRTATIPCLYFGLAGDAAILRILGDERASAAALRRLLALRDDTGWCVPLGGPDVPAVRANDVVAGMAGVAMAAVWCGGDDGLALARAAAGGLVDAAEALGDGLDWPMYPGQATRLPNFSHGTAGIASALAIAGVALGDATLVAAGRAGAAYLVSIGDLGGDGFTVPHWAPRAEFDEDPVTYSWCHGPTGTSLVFSALAHAGVDGVGGLDTVELARRCRRSVLDAGIPERRYPGFWDNDGQCCGTAGVGDMLLGAAQLASDERDAEECLAGAVRMGDALVSRAVIDEAGARWRFLEHRSPTPLLAPGTGWSQGAAGIAAFLLRLGRVLDAGLGVPVVDRPDTWWSVPAQVRTFGAAST